MTSPEDFRELDWIESFQLSNVYLVNHADVESVEPH